VQPRIIRLTFSPGGVTRNRWNSSNKLAAGQGQKTAGEFHILVIIGVPSPRKKKEKSLAKGYLQVNSRQTDSSMKQPSCTLSCLN
jgi:hypothetical protein